MTPHTKRMVMESFKHTCHNFYYATYLTTILPFNPCVLTVFLLYYKWQPHSW